MNLSTVSRADPSASLSITTAECVNSPELSCASSSMRRFASNGARLKVHIHTQMCSEFTSSLDTVDEGQRVRPCGSRPAYPFHSFLANSMAMIRSAGITGFSKLHRWRCRDNPGLKMPPVPNEMSTSPLAWISRKKPFPTFLS